MNLAIENYADADWLIKTETLSRLQFVNLMRNALALVGNSSMGILEAPHYKLPVVNIGDRQKGRLRGANVIDVSNELQSISEGIQTAQSSAFILSLADLRNPYYKGEVTQKIVGILKNTSLSDDILQKEFVNLSLK